MFKFSLREPVVIEASEEAGVVIGRYESVTAEPQYFVRYRASDGRAVESWWTESALYSTGSTPAAEVSAADVSRRTVGMVDGVAKAPDPTAGFATDRSVAAEAQEVEDGTN